MNGEQRRVDYWMDLVTWLFILQLMLSQAGCSCIPLHSVAWVLVAPSLPGADMVVCII